MAGEVLLDDHGGGWKEMTAEPGAGSPARCSRAGTQGWGSERKSYILLKNKLTVIFHLFRKCFDIGPESHGRAFWTSLASFYIIAMATDC